MKKYIEFKELISEDSANQMQMIITNLEKASKLLNPKSATYKFIAKEFGDEKNQIGEYDAKLKSILSHVDKAIAESKKLHHIYS